MADKVSVPPILTTAYTAKHSKKRKTVLEKATNKRLLDQARAQTRINIGSAFHRWRELRESKDLKTDTMVAVFLLDSYERAFSTPWKHGLTRPRPLDRDDDLSVSGVEELNNSSGVQQLHASMSSLELDIGVISADEFNNIQNSTIDWEDDTWYPDKETESVSSLEEDETSEEETDYDDSEDEDYMPRICVRTGGALKTQICLDVLPTISMEDTVYDVDNSQDPPTTDIPPLPETAKVLVEDDVIGHPASITYHDCLKQLAEYLVLPVNMCTAQDRDTKLECRARRPFQVNIKSKGTAAVVEWMCPHGHTVWRWTSQPTLQDGMHVGDFLLASNILLSGNNYATISLLFKFMNMGMVERSSFFRIQDSYCVDTIKDFWNEKRAEIITQLQSKGPVVALVKGDGRMDSPGFCAQYCTYAAMDSESKQIICLVNIDKRETLRNSVVMQKEGFMRTFETLRRELNLTEICTDARPQISALFNEGKYKDSGVHHTLDIWQGARNLGRKIHRAGQQKSCSILQMWNKDICNHFWHCCKTAENYEEFLDMWIGLMDHVTGEHAWALGACHHGPLVESRETEWIQKDSTAHQRLTELILDAHWLKDVHKYLHFRSTAELESFDNHILMYASKRFIFSPPVYTARTMLAGLDYNHHIHRPAKRKADGSIQYCKVYNKKSRKWSLYTLKVEKDYSYMADLQSAILRRRLSATEGTPQSRTRRPGGVLSGDPAPTTQEQNQEA